MKKRHYLTDSDIERIRHMIEVEHLQQWKVADKIGVHQGTIEKLCKRLGLKTQRTGPKNGEEHPDWKGGRTLRKGYWYVYFPGHPYASKGVPYVAEHRLVMEKKLGRYLLPGEVVHQIDSDPQNNDPENLIVFGSNAAHLKAELTGRIPNWTPDGYAKILQVAAKKRKYQGTKTQRAKQASQQYEKTHRRKGRGDGLPPQPIDHPKA